MVTGITPFLVVQIADGEQYVLHVDARSRFTSERGALPLSAADVPLGARAHVDGVMRSDGELAVARMTVRLSSASVDGTVKTLDKASWTVMAASGPITIRLTDQTAILQGSHVLAANDVVAGDAVTVDGYSIANRAVIARKILVHRRLAAFDGTIAALTADGFTLKTTSGDHPVIVSPSTTFSGGVATNLTAGMAVHVTGYLRGDGAILATRIRLGKKNMSRLASSPRLEQRLHQAELAVGIRVA
jgi:hypothetical protein